MLVLYLPSCSSALTNPNNVQVIVSHLRCNLCQFSCLIHCPHVPKSNSCFGFGAQDVHLPVIGFLAAFNTDVHMSILVLISSVAVSVTSVFFFFWNRDVSPMSNPQPGGPVGLRSEFSFS